MKPYLFFLKTFLIYNISFAQPLPFHPAVKTGKLDNGLTYYILKNTQPAKRAELRLCIKAGSVLEDDDQQGLAHFVEHMAFNGTKHFPKNELINFLESIGVKFGAHLNAYTGFDETVYMLQLPTDRAGIIDTSFQILEDWAQAVSFDNQEIDKERGVVIEEWRLGRDASERCQKKHNPIVFTGSQYAKRLPIGQKEIIETCNYDVLKGFYQEWYRPDLMAVIAVGDFDITQIEAKILSHFNKIPKAKQARLRPEFTLAENTEILISGCADSELPYTTISMEFRHPERKIITEQDYRKTIISQLFTELVSDRIDEFKRKGNTAIAYTYFNEDDFLGKKSTTNFWAIVKPDSILPALNLLLQEGYRAAQHGFLPDEVERKKKSLLAAVIHQAKEENKTESNQIVYRITEHFLRNKPLLSPQQRLTLYQKLLPTITYQEVGAWAAQQLKSTDRVLTISAAQHNTALIPDDNTLKNLIIAAANQKYAPYQDQTINKALVPKKPTAIKPVTIEKDLTYDLQIIKYPNGSRVIIKATKFKNDQVQFLATRPGGISTADNTESRAAEMAESVFSELGIGDFDATQLNKYLAGKNATLSPNISLYTENIRGYAYPDDIETLLEQLYLFFTPLRNDQTAFNMVKQRTRTFLINSDNDPESVYYKLIRTKTTADHPRVKPMDTTAIDSVKMSQLASFWQKRFSSANGFTFIFTGNIDTAKFIPLLNRWIGSLPGGEVSGPVDLGIRSPEKAAVYTLKKGKEPKSMVTLTWTGACNYNPRERFKLKAVIDVLRIKLREVMREDKSGVYGVQVYGYAKKFPIANYEITISFACAPERVNELIKTVEEQLDLLRKNPVAETYVAKIKETYRRELEVRQKENNFWIEIIKDAFTNDEPLKELAEQESYFDELSPEKLLLTSKNFLNTENLQKFILYPEQFEPKN